LVAWVLAPPRSSSVTSSYVTALEGWSCVGTNVWWSRPWRVRRGSKLRARHRCTVWSCRCAGYLPRAPHGLPEEPRTGLWRGDDATYGSECLANLQGVSVDYSRRGAPPAPAPCYVGGCSLQLCTDEPGGISACEYRDQYPAIERLRVSVRVTVPADGPTRLHSQRALLQAPKRIDHPRH
jgi:hypothetical protein